MNIELMPKKYPTRQSKSSLLAPLLEEFKNVQGVKAAALTEGFPISLSMTISSLKIDGKAAILPEGRSMAPAAIYGPCEVPISDDYFKTLGIPILKGRTFSDQEGRNNARLAVVNEEFVRRYVPSKDPIGLQVIFNEEETPRTIIGLVKSTYEYLTQQTLRPMIYTHFLEQYSKPPWPGYAPPSQSMVLIAKHDGNTAELAGAARRILQQLDPDQVINKTATLDEMLSEDYRQQQSVLILIGTSSVLALVLAFIGIYGVVSYHVTRRIQEIGIRRALGAGSGKIIRLILGQSTLSSFVGLLIGLAAAFALTRYIASMLYGVTPRDPVVFISISVVAITVSIIAGYIPSRRATRIELSTALRDE